MGGYDALASELRARADSLEAERLRPDVKPRSWEELLLEVIALLARLKHTPPELLPELADEERPGELVKEEGRPADEVRT